MDPGNEVQGKLRKLHINCVAYTHHAGWCSSNGLDLTSGGA